MPRRRRRSSEPNPRAGDPDAAREAALTLLERTRRTRSDLVRRLRERGFEPAVIESVIARLEAVGLVDDAEYARAWLAGRLGRRPTGARRLEMELRARGVSAEDVVRGRALLEAQTGVVDELAAARRAIASAAGRYAKLDPRVRRQRLWALLSRRGFDPDVIERALVEVDEQG